MTRTTWLALACAMTMACGGKTVGGAEGDGGGGAGGDASPGGPDGGTSAGDSGIVAHDASTTRDTGAPLGCVQGPGSGSGGQGSCEINVSETCSDGTTYQASCSCPAGSCSCSETSSMGGSSGGGIPFVGCPGSCPSPSQAFAACGFPQ